MFPIVLSIASLIITGLFGIQLKRAQARMLEAQAAEVTVNAENARDHAADTAAMTVIETLEGQVKTMAARITQLESEREEKWGQYDQDLQLLRVQYAAAEKRRLKERTELIETLNRMSRVLEEIWEGVRALLEQLQENNIAPVWVPAQRTQSEIGELVKKEWNTL